MRGLFISVLAAGYLYGASEPQSILGEVAKLRQKYEECRQGQSAVLGIEPKLYQQCEAERKDATGKLNGYQSRIASLETQIKENNAALTRLETQSRDLNHELSQKIGIIKNMEQMLTSRDKQYREAVTQNESLRQNINTVKVSKIERESLKSALATLKEEKDELTRKLNKAVAAHPAADASVKLQTMQADLSKAQATIARLQSAPTQAVLAEKVVYKDRPVIQEKIVTKVVEPTEKIKALQSELSAAQTVIANLKSTSGAKVIYKDRVVTQEKVVYKDRPVIQEKVVYKDRPVVQEKIVTKVVEPTEKIKALQSELATAQTTIANLKNAPAKVVIKEKIVPQEKVVYQDRIVTQEKVVYKDRPVVQEKIVTKVVEPTEKIKALQSELATAQTTIANLKNAPAKVVIKEKIVPQEKVVYQDRIVTQEKVVYKDRPVIQEKVVYKDRPVVQEKIVTKVDESARRQIDKLSLELERQKSKLAKAVIPPQPKPVVVRAVAVAAPQTATKLTAKSVTVPESAKKTVPPVSAKPIASTSTPPAPKKRGSSAYRMATNAPIYTAPGGAQVDTWEERRSFTAGSPSNGWVHITGYFVNRVWTATREDENLWVKESDVIKR
ncbi:hypothetical protein [Sulfuricurvum sp.]|uniref:hypothetical protein n=1 Tax=Sulfuricurvum sp. TaxID=2025608 RepID=UPI003567BAE2